MLTIQLRYQYDDDTVHCFVKFSNGTVVNFKSQRDDELNLFAENLAAFIGNISEKNSHWTQVIQEV